MGRQSSLGELYRRGLSLADAAFEFAPDSLLRGYRWSCVWLKAKTAAVDLQLITTLRSHAISESTKTDIASQLKIDLRNPPNDPFCSRSFNKYLRVYRSDRRRPGDYERLFQTELIKDIHEGKYIVIGIELPRSSKSKPTRVPDDVLRSSFGVDWDESILAGNGLQFVAVRLVRADFERGTRKSRGPESRGPEVTRKYKELVATGKIKPGDKPKVVTKRIHDAIVADPADDWGLHHVTIWRHVKPLHRSRRTK